MNLTFVKRLSLGFVTLALSGVMANAAEGNGFFGGVALINQLDSAKTATHSSTGYVLNGGYDFRVSDGSYGFRPSLSMNALSGSEKNGVKTELTGYQFASDIVFDSGFKNLSFVVGLSINRWHYKTTAAELVPVVVPAAPKVSGAPVSAAALTPSPVGLDGKDWMPGTKLGARIGADYRFTKNLSMDVLFQVVDFGSKDGEPKGTTYSSYGPGDNLQPSWLQVGVRYHF